MRLEIVLLGLFSAAWLLAIIVLLGLLPVAGILHLDLYRFYSFGAILGWVSGNVYVSRLRVFPPGRTRKQVLLNYLVGPLGFLYILRALAPREVQDAAPLVWIYSFFVYCLFFLVPVTLRVSRKPPAAPPSQPPEPDP